MSNIATVELLSAKTSDPQSRTAPILGAGTVEIRPDGIRISGRKSRQGLAVLAGVIVGLIGITAAAIVLVALGVEPDNRGVKKIAFLAGMGAGILPGVAVHNFVAKRLLGRTVEAVVPFTALRVLSASPGRCTIRMFAPDLRGDVTLVGDPNILSRITSPS